MIEPTAAEILDAAMREDAGKLHALVGELGMSSRHTMFAAGARMMNALAAADAHATRLREYATNLSPAAQAVLAGDVAAVQGLLEGERLGSVRALVRDGMMTPDGELTDAGRTVIQLRATQVRLLAQTRDRALSDEDMCHE